MTSDAVAADIPKETTLRPLGFLFVCLSAFLFVCLSVCLSVRLSVCLLRWGLATSSSGPAACSEPHRSQGNLLPLASPGALVRSGEGGGKARVGLPRRCGLLALGLASGWLGCPRGLASSLAASPPALPAQLCVWPGQSPACDACGCLHLGEEGLDLSGCGSGVHQDRGRLRSSAPGGLGSPWLVGLAPDWSASGRPPTAGIGCHPTQKPSLRSAGFPGIRATPCMILCDTGLVGLRQLVLRALVPST